MKEWFSWKEFKR